jgi:hypothetical protein
MPRVVRSTFHKAGCSYAQSSVPINECPCDCFEIVEAGLVDGLEGRVKELSATLLMAQGKLAGVVKALAIPEIMTTVAEIDSVLRKSRRTNEKKHC